MGKRIGIQTAGVFTKQEVIPLLQKVVLQKNIVQVKEAVPLVGMTIFNRTLRYIAFQQLRRLEKCILIVFWDV